MLTRSQVAYRLGKSIATVRRLEGAQLHPEVDANGIHWFDASEVANVARQLRARRRAGSKGRGVSAFAWPSAQDAEVERLDGEFAQLDLREQQRECADHVAEIEQLRARVRELEAALAAREAEFKATTEEDRTTRADLRRQLIEFMESSSERQLRRAAPELLHAVVDLLE